MVSRSKSEIASAKIRPTQELFWRQGSSYVDSYDNYVISFSNDVVLSGDGYYTLEVTYGCPGLNKQRVKRQHHFHMFSFSDVSRMGAQNGTSGDMNMSVTLCPSDEDYAFGCLDESACNYDPSANPLQDVSTRHVTGAQILQHAILTPTALVDRVSKTGLCR